MQLPGGFFQPGQVEQIVDHHQNAFGVIAGIDQQFKLLRRERPGRFLQQQMQCEPDAGERRFQFVTDGGDEIAFHFVEQAKAGDILQQHRGAARDALGIADGRDPRQERAGFLAETQIDRPCRILAASTRRAPADCRPAVAATARAVPI